MTVDEIGLEKRVMNENDDVTRAYGGTANAFIRRSLDNLKAPNCAA